ncbi:MAG TPA: inositol monophosphatase [Acidimicrobiales bacterium]|nr:inositol monophosphatase [Acidimicrobiales bacterium]
MPRPADLMDAVASVVTDVSAEAIEPRFSALTGDQIRTKAPGEVVTVADEQAEKLLTDRLQALLPAPVVGEEVCARRPSLLGALKTERAWLVDPLDGTANFVAGSPDWAVMVALVERGEAVASWIWQPVSRRMYAAESGSGAALDGTPIRVAAADPAAPPRGAVLRRFLDDATRARVDRPSVATQLGTVGPGRGCAGVEYPLLIHGAQDFVLFWRTLPWDHVPGVLLLREAGGSAARPDRSPYRAGDAGGWGLLAAADARTWDRTRDILFA